MEHLPDVPRRVARDVRAPRAASPATRGRSCRTSRPALDDLRPTLIALRDLSPDLKTLFQNLDPLIEAGEESLPAQREIFEGLRPVLGELGPWLSELNPILAWLGEHQHTVTRHLRQPRRRHPRDDVVARPAGHRPLPAPVRPDRRRDRLRPPEPPRDRTAATPTSTRSRSPAPTRRARGIIAAFDCKNTSSDDAGQARQPRQPGLLQPGAVRVRRDAPEVPARRARGLLGAPLGRPGRSGARGRS